MCIHVSVGTASCQSSPPWSPTPICDQAHRNLYRPASLFSCLSLHNPAWHCGNNLLAAVSPFMCVVLMLPGAHIDFYLPVPTVWHSFTILSTITIQQSAVTNPTQFSSSATSINALLVNPAVPWVKLLPTYYIFGWKPWFASATPHSTISIFCFGVKECPALRIHLKGPYNQKAVTINSPLLSYNTDRLPTAHLSDWG